MTILTGALLATGCIATSSSRTNNDSSNNLAGESSLKTGAFSTIKELEFMYVFNAGGTMTESSNYDASPPAPPAYGVWRRIKPGQFEAQYAFYITKAPAGFEDIAKGGGWPPAGHGVFVEKITLSEDGKSFKSTIRYDAFDQTGRPTESGSAAETQAVRMTF